MPTRKSEYEAELRKTAMLFQHTTRFWDFVKRHIRYYEMQLDGDARKTATEAPSGSNYAAKYVSALR